MTMDYNDRKHILLVSLLETISEATTEMDIEENTDCGTISTPVFRYEPQFDFTEEDIQTIREIANEEGMDFSQLLGEEE